MLQVCPVRECRVPKRPEDEDTSQSKVRPPPSETRVHTRRHAKPLLRVRAKVANVLAIKALDQFGNRHERERVRQSRGLWYVSTRMLMVMVMVMAMCAHHGHAMWAARAAVHAALLGGHHEAHVVHRARLLQHLRTPHKSCAHCSIQVLVYCTVPTVYST